jgi:diguanylate cyclase (GGDEF)-like protein
MRPDSLIALRISHAAPSAVAALRFVLERALALVDQAVLAIESETDRRELSAQLDHVRAGLDEAGEPDAIRDFTDSCFAVCEQAIERLRTQQHEQRSELQRLVALVRDTVAMLAGDGDAFSSDIEQAAGRFNSLLQLSDVHQLKRRLAAEVGGLQKIAAERQQQWRRSVGMFESRIETLERQLDAVRREANLDALTGIANRRFFERRVREVLLGPDRQLIVGVFDLDNFKAVNDTGGHAAGDSLLRGVAQALKSSVRRDDIVARLGGDEFAVLGIGATLRDAEHRMRGILTSLGTIPTGVEKPSHVAASCGLTEYCAGDTFESIVRRADQGLYDAKRHGKGRLVVKTPPFIRDLLSRKP